MLLIHYIWKRVIVAESVLGHLSLLTRQINIAKKFNYIRIFDGLICACKRLQ